MTIALVIMEGLILSFWLLLICVVGIANGPVGLVVFYEKEVQLRAIDLGLTTLEKIKKNDIDISTALDTKMVENVKKYPAELVKGKNKKYNEY